MSGKLEAEFDLQLALQFGDESPGPVSRELFRFWFHAGAAAALRDSQVRTPEGLELLREIEAYTADAREFLEDHHQRN